VKKKMVSDRLEPRASYRHTAGMPKIIVAYHYTKQPQNFVNVYAWYPDWEFLFQTGIILFNPHT